MNMLAYTEVLQHVVFSKFSLSQWRETPKYRVAIQYRVIFYMLANYIIYVKKSLFKWIKMG